MKLAIIILLLCPFALAQPNYSKLEEDCKNETDYHLYFKKDPKRFEKDILVMYAMKNMLVACALAHIHHLIKDNPVAFCGKSNKRLDPMSCVSDFLSRNTTTTVGLSLDFALVADPSDHTEANRINTARNFITVIENIDLKRFYLSTIKPSTSDYAKILETAKSDDEKELAKLLSTFELNISRLLDFNDKSSGSVDPEIKALTSRLEKLKKKTWKYPALRP